MCLHGCGGGECVWNTMILFIKSINQCFRLTVIWFLHLLMNCINLILTSNCAGPTFIPAYADGVSPFMK